VGDPRYNFAVAEITIEPSALARLERDDWAARAMKVTAEAPRWCVVMIDDKPTAKGRARFAESELVRYGVRAECQSLRGLGRHPRPWSREQWVTFARVKP
jgi:hypothetical protein